MRTAWEQSPTHPRPCNLRRLQKRQTTKQRKRGILRRSMVLLLMFCCSESFRDSERYSPKPFWHRGNFGAPHFASTVGPCPSRRLSLLQLLRLASLPPRWFLRWTRRLFCRACLGGPALFLPDPLLPVAPFWACWVRALPGPGCWLARFPSGSHPDHRLSTGRPRFGAPLSFVPPALHEEAAVRLPPSLLLVRQASPGSAD